MAFLIAALVGMTLADESTPIALVEIARSSPIHFNADIFPILEGKCIVCHDRDGGLAEGDLDLTTAASAMKGGKRGAGFVAGKGAESLLFLRASHRAAPVMPPEGEGEPMTSEEVSLLKRWIDEGASAGSNAMPTKGRETPVEWKSLDASIQSTYAVDVAADGSWLAAGRGATVVVVDIATGETRATLMGHQDIVQSLAISPDGHRIAIGGFEEVHVWARRAGEPAHAHWDGPTRWKAGRDRVTALAFSPDGSMLAGSTGVPTSGGTITLWRSDGTIAQTLTDVHSDSITSLAFSPDGQWLASGSADKFLKVHSVSEKKTPRNFEGHTGYVLDVAWRADGLTLATASADKTIKIWSVETGEQVRTIGGHTGEITGLSYLADTATLATSCSDRVGRLVNSDNGNIDKVLEGASNYLVSLAASKDGKLIAAGTPSGHIHLWTSDGKPPRTVEPAPAANVSSAK